MPISVTPIKGELSIGAMKDTGKAVGKIKAI